MGRGEMEATMGALSADKANLILSLIRERDYSLYHCATSRSESDRTFWGDKASETYNLIVKHLQEAVNTETSS